MSWDPSGVTAVITPWNAPLMLATWRAGARAGRRQRRDVKPPEWAPLTASMPADIVGDAGLPSGALDVVQGIGEEAGAALYRPPRGRPYRLDGFAATGRLVAGRRPPTSPRRRSSSAGSRLRRVRRSRIPRRRREAGRGPVRQRRTGASRRHEVVFVVGRRWRTSWTASPRPPAPSSRGPRLRPPTSAADDLGHLDRVDGSCGVRRPKDRVRASMDRRPVRRDNLMLPVLLLPLIAQRPGNTLNSRGWLYYGGTITPGTMGISADTCTTTCSRPSRSGRGSRSGSGTLIRAVRAVFRRADLDARAAHPGAHLHRRGVDLRHHRRSSSWGSQTDFAKTLNPTP